jgi:hypothetical protein
MAISPITSVTRELVSILDDPQSKLNFRISEITYQLLSQMIEGKERPSSRLLVQVAEDVIPKVKSLPLFRFREARETLSMLQFLSVFTREKSMGLFLRGELKGKSDIPLIQYLIKNLPKESVIFSPPESFVNSLSQETAVQALTCLFEEKPDYCLEHIESLRKGIKDKLDEAEFLAIFRPT